MTLAFDHVFCVVPADGDAAARLAAAGWRLDDGTRHPGQGTANRRLVWAEHYLELVSVVDVAEARANPLRLDRRSEEGASPFGVVLRGRPPEGERPGYRLHEDLGFPLWVRRDDEDPPRRPLVAVLDLPAGRRPATTPVNPGRLAAIHHTGPAPLRAPPWSGPGWSWAEGPHRLELAVDSGAAVRVSDVLAIVRGVPGGGQERK